MSDLERRLADALKGVSERHLEEAPHGAGTVLQQVIQRVRRRWGTFVVTTSAVAALVLALAAVSVPRLVSDRGGASNDVAHAALVPVTTTIEIGKNPVAIAADDDAVWVALENGSLQTNRRVKQCRRLRHAGRFRAHRCCCRGGSGLVRRNSEARRNPHRTARH